MFARIGIPLSRDVSYTVRRAVGRERLEQCRMQEFDELVSDHWGIEASKADLSIECVFGSVPGEPQVMFPVHVARDPEGRHVTGMQANGYIADGQYLDLLDSSTPLLTIRFQAN